MQNEQKKKPARQVSWGLFPHLERWRKEPAVEIILLLLVVAMLIFIWFFGEQGGKAGPDLAKFIAYLLGGGVIIWQLDASIRRASAMEKTVELTEKGNIAERFKNAVEHLGNSSNATRLGGIYALHSIAREDKDSEYRKQVFEILCAYVRGTTIREDYIAKNKMQPSVVIDSILNLLFISPDYKIYQKLQANLEGSNLRGAKLRQAHLSGTNLSGANLQDVDLQGAVLVDANLDEANLQNAKLNARRIDSEFLRGKRIDDPRLNNARINDKIFAGADLQRATLYDANLQGADLEGAEHLDIELLLFAKTLYETKLPDETKENIRQRKPKLLEKPADQAAN